MKQCLMQVRHTCRSQSTHITVSAPCWQWTQFFLCWTLFSVFGVSIFPFVNPFKQPTASRDLVDARGLAPLNNKALV